MKKIFYLISLSVLLFSCERELIYGSDFEFEIKNLIETPVYINSLKPFQLEIVKKISMSDNKNYSLSFKSTEGSFNLKKGNETLLEEINYSVTFNDLERLNLDIIPLNSEEIILEITLKDNNQIIKTKVISITPVYLSTPFILTKVNDFALKNTNQVNFSFTMTGVVPTNTYQIKFTTNNLSKILKPSGEELLRDQWRPFSLNTSTNLYTYVYNALSDVNDVLEVQIKDNLGQIKTISYNVTIFAKPVINNYTIQFGRGNPIGLFSNWSVTGQTRSTILITLTGGATLLKTRIVVRNRLTNTNDTLDFDGEGLQQMLEFVNANGNSSATALTNCINNSKYAGQLYTIQIQDSDNVWSSLYNGTVLN